MQTTSKALQIVGGATLLLSLSLGQACNRRDGFEEAMAKSRGTVVDQVNTVTSDVPYYAQKALNPIDSAESETPVVEIPKFKLLDQHGNERDESLFKGKTTVVGFIFTSCNGFCPFVIEGMKKLAKSSKSEVQFVAFTVDPEHDRPAQLQEYAKKRGLDDKNWTLLTGDKAVLTSIAKETFSSQTFQKKSVARDFVHSEHLYIIDADGRLRGIVNGTKVDVDEEGAALIASLHKSRNQSAQ